MKKEIRNIKHSEEMMWDGLTDGGSIQHVILRFSK
jgi:hypothetical protein